MLATIRPAEYSLPKTWDVGGREVQRRLEGWCDSEVIVIIYPRGKYYGLG